MRYIRNLKPNKANMRRIGGVFLVWMLATGAVHAQQTIETFGQNRIQFKKFDWKYLSSENFDVHFYGERRKVAEEAPDLSP
jgi:hypothetical protein